MHRPTCLGSVRIMLAAVVTAVSAAALGLALGPPAVAAPSPTGSVYLIQGVVGSSWDLSLDGKTTQDVAAKEILGPFDLEPGSHRVEATSEEGTTVEGSVRIEAGESMDVVLHLPVDASGTPLLTTFTNDLTPVPAGCSRLAIAHTAAVGPADIKVDGSVLFADVASGEELSVTVPTDTYRVAVVPAATDDPPVFGPADLEVPAGQSIRVFAIGVAETGTMDAVIHAMPIRVRGSAAAPAGVPGGSGGHQGTGQPSGVLALTGVALLALAGAASGCGRRRAGPSR